MSGQGGSAFRGAETLEAEGFETAIFNLGASMGAETGKEEVQGSNAMGTDAEAEIDADTDLDEDPDHVDEIRIDAFAFARKGKFAQGSIDIERLARMVDGLPEQPAGEAGLVKWSVRGEIGESGLHLGKYLLHFHVQANPLLECQRCNALFVFPVNTETVLHLVKSEDDLDSDDFQAESQEEDFVDDLPEKVVGSHHFDLLAQVEDELILSVPYVPKHDICPGAQATASEASQEPVAKRPSPFAVLEQLKHKD